MYIKLTLQEKLKDERTSRHMTLAELEKGNGHSKSHAGIIPGRNGLQAKRQKKKLSIMEEST